MDRRIALVLDEKENYDQAVKRFRSLCDMHRIPCGEAGNLRQFVTALKQDRHFAMDFWAMVGELSVRERGTLSDDEMLAMIVEGSSGKTVAELPLSDKVATAELKNMLAGVDVDAPPIEDSRGEAPIAPMGDAIAVEEESPRVEEDEALTTEPARAADVVQTKLSVEDALRRLEETSRELRDQLAALNQLKREATSSNPAAAAEDEIEIRPVAKDAGLPAPAQQSPRAELEHPAIEAPEVYATPPHEFEPLAAVEPVLTPRRARGTIPNRKVLAPPQFNTLSHRGFTPPDGDDDPTIPVPLAEYAEANSRRVGAGTILLIILVLALAAGGFALHEGYGREQLEQAKTALLTKIGLFGEELHDVASPTSGATGSQSGDKPQTAPSSNGRPSVAQPVPKTPPAQPPAQQQQDSGIRQDSAPQPRSEGDGRPRAASRPEAMPIEPGAVRVPASVMAGNLLSSRVPVYPESARDLEIEGPVDLQAVISRTGAVEYARALSGDPHLRAAAEDAVLKWKYKPYLINGTPVQAVTQVRVNFRLP